MRFPTPETLRISAHALGIDRTGLQELFGVSSRTAQRWIATSPAPEPVQEQIARWQAAASAELEAVLSEIDQAWTPGDPAVRLIRYPAADLMPPEHDDRIWEHSPATYDAFVARLAATLHDQGVPVIVETATQPTPHARFTTTG